jgi:hypothetical protein
MKRTLAAIVLLTVFSSACTRQSPVAPAILTESGATPVASSGSRLSSLSADTSPFGGTGIPLIEVSGSVPSGGAGVLNDPQTATPGYDTFELTVNVHGGPPDTDLFFQFAADIFPGTRGDSVCPGFPSPPDPGNSIRTLHTSAGGAVAAHIRFPVPAGAFGGAFDAGVKSDFAWRVVNLTETFDLRTPCIVLTGK